MRAPCDGDCRPRLQAALATVAAARSVPSIEDATDAADWRDGERGRLDETGRRPVVRLRPPRHRRPLCGRRQARATGYLAAMGILGLEPKMMKPTTLAMNLVVAGIAVDQFRRAGHFASRPAYPSRARLPLLALWARAVRLPEHVCYPLVSVILLLASAQMFRSASWPRPAPTAAESRSANVLAGAVRRRAVGFIYGTTGAGGGVFLAPVIPRDRLGGVRRTAAVTAPQPAELRRSARRRLCDPRSPPADAAQLASCRGRRGRDRRDLRVTILARSRAPLSAGRDLASVRRPHGLALNHGAGIHALYISTRGQPADKAAQHTSRNRSTQIRSTSSPSRFHQFSAEKISTSCGP